ncbi:hypothetical protein HYDPIDRAFT_31313 [Hydnomerulius pinastri MD-312]|uniref:Uncharacterized protein n=1 Tax=Hydnomerulius pinastri MD-312 TaxID=994086 RepID=A0A0C9V723_9AGAM|nr:hypothetical protein HYDPIDRAFT_31313 [Hydnomerulius pinastri MD-312]
MSNYSAQSQYAAAAHVPLIKSPALRVPPPVELPPDIHPLPDSVTPYFVYPFTLEPHVLTVESSRRSTLASHLARREALLRSREDEKERRKREALKRVAPGFDGNGSVLTPMRATSSGSSETQSTSSGTQIPENRGSVNVMDDLVDQLAKMDAQQYH